jgi:hypothetical protein
VTRIVRAVGTIDGHQHAEAAPPPGLIFSHEVGTNKWLIKLRSARRPCRFSAASNCAMA